MDPFRVAERANGRTAAAPGVAPSASRAGFRVVVVVRPVFARWALSVRRRPRVWFSGCFLGVRLFVRPRVSVQRAYSPAGFVDIPLWVRFFGIPLGVRFFGPAARRPRAAARGPGPGYQPAG